MKHYYTVWRCRCCGEKFENLEYNSNKDLLGDMLNDFTSERNNHISHKCDPEYTGVADFVGVKLIEDK